MQSKDVGHELIPLDLATKSVYARLYAEQHAKAGRTCTEQDLNALATAITALVPLFTYDGEGANLARLDAADIKAGLFRGGARRLIFLDGRPALENLAVKAHHLEGVVFALKNVDL